MAVCDRKMSIFIFMLAGVVGDDSDGINRTIYPFTSTCAIRGSTVTLPCTFRPLLQYPIIRVRWCQNHPICQDTTPSVYDSKSSNNDPRYQYLGDRTTNCTLQIRDIQMRDNATFRFRMEAQNSKGHFTNQTGVAVTVVDRSRRRISSSSDNNEFKHGETVTLSCTSILISTCSSHQLNITWYRDGVVLPETGPSLRIDPLTAKDSGNYTCALWNDMKTKSEPRSLLVDEEPAGNGQNVNLIVAVVVGVLLAVIILILFIFIARRKLSAEDNCRSAGDETETKHSDKIYSNTMKPTEKSEHEGRELSGCEEEVCYTSVQFQQQKKNHRGRWWE
ncbi:uncharacterized protein KZ484_025089 isoform 2-T2 [Pholidichthys leucotaenia]